MIFWWCRFGLYGCLWINRCIFVLSNSRVTALTYRRNKINKSVINLGPHCICAEVFPDDNRKQPSLCRVWGKTLYKFANKWCNTHFRGLHHGTLKGKKHLSNRGTATKSEHTQNGSRGGRRSRLEQQGRTAKRHHVVVGEERVGLLFVKCTTLHKVRQYKESTVLF